MLENELLLALEERLRDMANKQRDINIICFYYGFHDVLWPTLEETAKHFNLNERERVRQIIKTKFRDTINASDIPSAEACLTLLNKKQYWIESDLIQLLIEHNFINATNSIRGLLYLLDDLGFKHDYNIYTPDLNKATRNTIEHFEENFVIKKNSIKLLSEIHKKAINLPGRCGIANLDWIKDEPGARDNYEILSKLIKYSKYAWTKKRDDGFWYIFENRDNTIVNYSEKVFSVISQCSSARLAAAYRNALDSRTHKYPYPNQEIIKSYLESSIFFDNIDGELIFTGQTQELNDIEKDAIDYLLSRGTTNLKDFRDHLLSQGYGKPHIDKNVIYSPLIYVDRTQGRKNYVYSLVSTATSASSQKESKNDYQKYHERLRKIHLLGTDDTIEQIRRREQPILSDWLFYGKTHEECAICGNTFNVGALVTAHKKKRSECNEAERLDPYIVMPLCVFGCDYLYENGYLYVDKGIIRKGRHIDNGTHEIMAVEKLDGRTLPDSWLRGPQSYFYKSFSENHG